MLGQYLLLFLAVTTANCCAPHSPRRTPQQPPPPWATTLQPQPTPTRMPMPCGAFAQISDGTYNGQFGAGSFDMTAEPPASLLRVVCSNPTPTIYYVNDADVITQATAMQCMAGQWMATNRAGGDPVVVANPVVRCAPVPMPCMPFGNIEQPIYNIQIGADYDMTAAPPASLVRVVCSDPTPTIYYVNDADVITQATAMQCMAGQWMATNRAGGDPVVVANPVVRCAPVPMPCMPFGNIEQPIYNIQIGADYDMTAAPPASLVRVVCSDPTPTIYYVNDADVITQATAMQCMAGQWMATNRAGGDPVVVANPVVRCAPVPMPCMPFGNIEQPIYNIQIGADYDMTAAPPASLVRVVCSDPTPTIYYVNDADVITQATAMQCMAGQWMATNRAGGDPVVVANPVVRCAPVPMPCMPFGNIEQPIYNIQIGADYDMTAAPPASLVRVVCSDPTPTIYYVNDADVITQATAMQCMAGQWMATNRAGGDPVVVANPVVRCAPVPMPCMPFGNIEQPIYNIQIGADYDMTAAPPASLVRVVCSDPTPTIYYVNDADVITQATAMQCMAGQWMATNTVGGGQVVVANPMVRCAPVPMPCMPFGNIEQPIYNIQIGADYDMTAAPPASLVRVVCSDPTPTIYYLNAADNMVTQATAIQCTEGRWMATNAVGGGAPVVVANPLVRCGPMP